MLTAIRRLQPRNWKSRRHTTGPHCWMSVTWCFCLVSFCSSTILLRIFKPRLSSHRNIYVGSLADWVGRRAAILGGCVVFLLGGSIQTAAQNIHYMYGGRFLAGMGIGMLAMLAPCKASRCISGCCCSWAISPANQVTSWTPPFYHAASSPGPERTKS